MPRGRRHAIANGLYHVTNRGLERREIVRDPLDRLNWFRLLDPAATRYGWRVFAYILMPNHFHLYLRTPEPNLSLGMHDFESGFVSLFNKHHERPGPLFQGRFHAVLVENDSHSWELSRNLHLNAVRAGLVKRPGEYPFSSFRFYCDPRKAPTWLDWRTVLAEFGPHESAARAAYHRFIKAGIAQPPRNPLDDVVDGWLLGSSEFVDRYRDWDDEPLESPRREPVTFEQLLAAVQGELRDEARWIFETRRHANRARDVLVLLCRELLDESLETLGQRFGGVGKSTLCEAANRARKRAEGEPELAMKIETIRKQMGSGVQNSKLPASRQF